MPSIATSELITCSLSLVVPIIDAMLTPPAITTAKDFKELVKELIEPFIFFNCASWLFNLRFNCCELLDSSLLMRSTSL